MWGSELEPGAFPAPASSTCVQYTHMFRHICRIHHIILRAVDIVNINNVRDEAPMVASR